MIADNNLPPLQPPSRAEELFQSQRQLAIAEARIKIAQETPANLLGADGQTVATFKLLLDYRAKLKARIERLVFLTEFSVGQILWHGLARNKQSSQPEAVHP